MFQQQNDPRQARREFARAEREAAILEKIDDLVQVSASHANAANGLEATGLTDLYEAFKQRYEASPPEP